jgi:predicted DNA-binding protein (MmcQ/YjbR family)
MIDRLRTYALEKAAVTEETPFGPDTVVYKVAGKIFMFVGLDTRPLSIALKGDPEDNLELRARYPAVEPGFHLNKSHWNSITLDNSIPWEEIIELIDISYDLVVASLSKSQRALLQNATVQ